MGYTEFLFSEIESQYKYYIIKRPVCQSILLQLHKSATYNQEQAEKIKAYAENKGMSLNSYVNELIRKDMEQED